MSPRHWSEDPYWKEATDAFDGARSRGVREVRIDLDALEDVICRADGPAYRLLDAMLGIRAREADDGYQGAPRVLGGLLMRLAQLTCASERSSSDTLPPSHFSDGR